MTLRLKHLILSAILMTCPMLASAGIFANMQSMVMSNSTQPSTFSTADRVGLFGGSFQMRAPIQNVNLVTFDPPRIDAGCGGIDLFGGSFSFINGQQLVQIFREVAADAAGLAFKAAIKAISPSLDALITEFQTLLQSMNNLAKNSCQMAHLLVDPIDNDLSNAVNGDGNIAGTNSNMFTDAFGTLTTYLANANTFLQQQASNNPKSGNGLVKTVVASGASSIMGMAGLTNIDGSSDDPTNPNSLNNEILYALLGYEIDAIPCSNLNLGGSAPSTSTPSGNSLGMVACTGPALMTLDDIIRGGGTGSARPDIPLQLYQCANPNGSGSLFGGVDPQICTQMITINFNYSGISGWVYTELFGNPDPAGAITSNSIVGMATSGSSFTWTPSQIQFLNQAGVPLLRLLTKTSNPTTRVQIAQILAPRIIECVATQIGYTLYKGASLIQTTTGYTLTPDQKANVERLRSDYLKQQQLCNSNSDVLRVVEELNQDAILNSSDRQ